MRINLFLACRTTARLGGTMSPLNKNRDLARLPSRCSGSEQQLMDLLHGPSLQKAVDMLVGVRVFDVARMPTFGPPSPSFPGL